VAISPPFFPNKRALAFISGCCHPRNMGGYRERLKYVEARTAAGQTTGLAGDRPATDSGRGGLAAQGRQEGGRRSLGEVCFDGGGEVLEDVPLLQAAGFDGR